MNSDGEGEVPIMSTRTPIRADPEADDNIYCLTERQDAQFFPSERGNIGTPQPKDYNVW